MTAKEYNPFLSLDYQTALESLGEDYFDVVDAAVFPQKILRFRNDQLLQILGLPAEKVSDRHFTEAFGEFQGVRPFLALRYHGYQLGHYNPYLGDGRGFIYGQIRGGDGRLYDLGTKGSGTTPYSRNADGRLTLKGGVREVLAGEALFQLGVNTSRCLSLVETGESLWRGDEPSPTRAAVMVRFSHSHLRFGTFERLHYLQRPDLIERLLDHLIYYYYPELIGLEDAYPRFYAQLVTKVATLAAQWMAAGFCHGVLNTDNMSLTGESFDYGPYAFIPTYNPRFTAAYFDYGSLYSYGNQPRICYFNLEKLQIPLSMVIPISDLERGLAEFDECYENTYRQLMLQKLGFTQLSTAEGSELLAQTIQLLQESQIGYHQFFAELAQQFNYAWRSHPETILENSTITAGNLAIWRNIYQRCLQQLEIETIGDRLSTANPQTALLRPVIESVWDPIAQQDDWEPFYALLLRISQKQ
ncbi:YdiU family protein [Gloeocapsa sp. PCC 73106]|uniref:protein adenylyltransferase SelO n=1 Tax=Gloeocapsa sp. PCC 73106 TaxID=102232 RepID=UPI0002ABC4F7|nr:YdiU family protein [Gloeocapsa sp. PCC 73106]ELR96735.1 hypothetical protein GLO73106DRAFT_00005330 [Gloeocapsa sp. PCC 73106]